jgi:hypothetical protein
VLRYTTRQFATIVLVLSILAAGPMYAGNDDDRQPKRVIDRIVRLLHHVIPTILDELSVPKP